MAERGDPQVLRLVVILLRSKTRMTQEEFGRAARVDQATLSKYEKGHLAPPEEVRQRFAKVAGVEWHLVVHLTRFLTAVLAAADRQQGGAVGRESLETALLSLMPLLIEEESEPDPPAPEELLSEARDIWSALERYPLAERWKHIETAPHDACRSWAALARVISEASAEAADGERTEAVPLAELALLTASRGAAGKNASSAA